MRRGDTLFAISRREGISVDALIAENKLSPPYALAVGQRLSRPSGETAGPSTTPASSRSATAAPRRHPVERGETLYAISRRYDVSVASLAGANDLRPPYALAVGQSLTVPSSSSNEVAASAAPRATPSSSPRPVTVPEPRRTPTVDPIPAPSPAVATPGPARPERAPRSTEPPDPPARAAEGFLLPVKGRVVRSFGPQEDGLHSDGVNIAAPRGTPIRASDNGVVAYVGDGVPAFGRLILVRHASGWTTAYAHAEAVLVERNEIVQRGQVIARVGSTGSVSDPQLHFEVRRGERAVDPKGQVEGL